jgi:hypothetical protein
MHRVTLTRTFPFTSNRIEKYSPVQKTYLGGVKTYHNYQYVLEKGLYPLDAVDVQYAPTPAYKDPDTLIGLCGYAGAFI